MNQISIGLRDNQTHFECHDMVQGVASWNLTGKTDRVSIRLVWFTSGKGTPDVCVVQEQQLESPASMGQSEFRFTLPDGPHSFSGQYISLGWAIEAIAWGPRAKVITSGRAEIVVAPGGQELLLPRVDNPLKLFKNKFAQRKAEYLLNKARDQGKIPPA